MTDKNKAEPIGDKDLEESSGGAIQPARSAAKRMQCSNVVHTEPAPLNTTIGSGD